MQENGDIHLILMGSFSKYIGQDSGYVRLEFKKIQVVLGDTFPHLAYLCSRKGNGVLGVNSLRFYWGQLQYDFFFLVTEYLTGVISKFKTPQCIQVTPKNVRPHSVKLILQITKYTSH